jgi:hypothetical protein
MQDRDRVSRESYVKLLPAFSGPLVDNALHYQQALRAKDLQAYVCPDWAKVLQQLSRSILFTGYTVGVRER